MQRAVALLILLILESFTNSGTASQKSTEAGKEEPRVACSIWLEDAVLNPDSAAFLHVSVENNSSNNVVIIAMTARLRPKHATNSDVLHERIGSYWSPIDVETKAALKPVRDPHGSLTYPETKLPLKTKGTAELTLDISALEWGDDKSSSLPSLRLRGVVPDGSYELALSLAARDSTGELGVVSNKISVEIQRQRRQ